VLGHIIARRFFAILHTSLLLLLFTSVGKTMSLNCFYQQPYCSWSMEGYGGSTLTGENRRTRIKACPSSTSSATNPAWTDQGSNPGIRGENPRTNRLSHGTAYVSVTEVTSVQLLRIPSCSLQDQSQWNYYRAYRQVRFEVLAETSMELTVS
jgi:hypothetical protein